LLVAVSGGADSMGLLHALVEADRAVVRVATVDHGLHALSRTHAVFVAEQCAALGVRCEMLTLDVDALRREAAGVGVEAAARTARYAALRRTAAVEDAWLVTGHTADDALESLFLRLGVGAGLRALAGPARSHERIWRPFLEVSRSVLRVAVVEARVPFVEDPTNAQVRFARNAVRADVLPALDGALGSGWRGAAGRSLAELRGLRDALDALDQVWPAGAAERTPDGAVRLPLEAMRRAPRGLRRWSVQRALRRAGLGTERGHRGELERVVDWFEAPHPAPIRVRGGWGLVLGDAVYLVADVLLVPAPVQRLDGPEPRVRGLFGVHLSPTTLPQAAVTPRSLAPHYVSRDARTVEMSWGPVADPTQERFTGLGHRSARTLAHRWAAMGLVEPLRRVLPVLRDGSGRIVWATALGPADDQRLGVGEPAWRVEPDELPEWSRPK
jgi:tRNA(Ile)-lysidine synthase